MHVVGVAIGGGSNRVFWQALKQALGNEPELRVINASSPEPINEILRSEQPRVLIVEVPSDGPKIEYQHYLDDYPWLMIIGLHPGTADMILHMRDIGLDLLVKLIRSVPDEDQASSSAEPPPRLRLFRPSDVEHLVLSSHHSDNSDDGMDGDVMRWLDVCLQQRLMREGGTDDRGGAPAWTLSAERARALLDPEYAGRTEEQLRAARENLETSVFTNPRCRFCNVCEAFDLAPIERQMLLMALAPELDGRYSRVIGFLHDDLTRRRPSATLLADVLMPDGAAGWDARRMLTADHTLGRYQLLWIDSEDPLPGGDAAIMIAPEIAAHLLAAPGSVPEFAPFLSVTRAEPANATANLCNGALRETLDAWQDDAMRGQAAAIIQLVGGAEACAWFRHGVLESGHTLEVLDLAVIETQSVRALSETALAAVRVAVMHGAVLLIVGTESLTDRDQRWFDRKLVGQIHRLVPRLAVLGPATWVAGAAAEIRLLERPRLDRRDREAMWLVRARALEIALSAADAEAMSSTVAFGEAEIDATLRLCGGEEPDRYRLQAAARRVSRTAIPSSVRRIEAVYGWDDIVLPRPIIAELRRIPVHVRYSGEVLDDWGYRARMPYGHGVAALFSGPSGTGKTMAAQIIARELGVELFQVDLANTVSKYIGETEKNLDVVFNAAERAGAVLAFEEADALFGKRTEVRDAHDRYANLEVAYLLQRIEAYGGVTVLTSNLRQNLDSAFIRRFRFIVEFPVPDVADREAIWHRVFPPQAPIAEDVNFELLARQLNLTGGHIQQISIRAAFAAASGERVIDMRHVVEATREELRKLGMVHAEKSLPVVAA